jgi:hypothetical protein
MVAMHGPYRPDAKGYNGLRPDQRGQNEEKRTMNNETATSNQTAAPVVQGVVMPCPTCDGSGSLRHNRMEDRKYIFGFIVCHNCGGSGTLDVDKWHRDYKDLMMMYGGLTEVQAQEALDAGMGEYDYSDAPSDAVLEEISCWTD